MKAHEYTHSGKKPWECPHCGRCFNQKANMQRHLLIHNAERKFKCETCGKTFTQPQTLKAHMVVHADKKPHECHICGKKQMIGHCHHLLPIFESKVSLQLIKACVQIQRSHTRFLLNLTHTHSSFQINLKNQDNHSMIQ